MSQIAEISDGNACHLGRADVLKNCTNKQSIINLLVEFHSFKVVLCPSDADKLTVTTSLQVQDKPDTNLADHASNRCLLLHYVSYLNNKNENYIKIEQIQSSKGQKQPTRGVLRKSSSKNMQQMYGRTPMPTCDLNKVALQRYRNHALTWVFSCKFAVYFQNTLY